MGAVGRGRVGDHEFKSRSSLALTTSSRFNFSASVVHSQLVCFLPVDILHVSLF